jgi:hypothetical protein
MKGKSAVAVSVLLCLAVAWIVCPVPLSRAGEVPPEIGAVIDHDGMKKYPRDAGARDDYVAQQKAAYLQVRDYRAPEVPPQVLACVREKAAQGFPANYTAQKFFIDTQVRD